MNPRPALHIVTEPEDDLRDLFAAERQLERDLADTRAGIVAARAAYARKHGLCGMPRVETLRRMFGGSQ